MAVAERSPAEAARAIASALEAVGLEHAIGGALALAVAGVPRGTKRTCATLHLDPTPAP